MCAKIAFLGLVAVLSSSAYADEKYGVDASWPIHHSFLSDNSTTLKLFGPEKIDLYKEYISGCKTRYKDREEQCVWNEEERLRLNREQPPEMANHTAIGFKKTRLSDELWTTLREYWEEFMERSGIEGMAQESWPEANTYGIANQNETRTPPHGPIWKEVEQRVKEWIPSATRFSKSSLYGIRAYTSGGILATHVDRDPLITSAIINVGQDVDEDWPLEVYDHEGRAHNITMQPGDVVLYESHSGFTGDPFR